MTAPYFTKTQPTPPTSSKTHAHHRHLFDQTSVPFGADG